MAQYGGFDPGTYQAWALNLTQSVFGTAGIARGFQVTAPGGMTVNVTLDPTALDAVCYLPNGCWVRLDAQQSFTVPANGTGGTRTDAIVAFVDPTGGTTPPNSLTYQTNWATGFGANNNQFVIALISVAANASNIVSGNISMNTAVAKLGNAGGASNSMVATDGVGLAVQDNSTLSQLSVVLTGLTTGVGRSIVLQTTDKSGISRQFLFNSDGTALFPGTVTMSGGVQATNLTVMGALNVVGAATLPTVTGPITFNNPLSGGNKLLDLEQGYAMYSDNTAGTFVNSLTRLWFDAPLNGEMHFGGRAGVNVLAGIRFRTFNAFVDNGTIQNGLGLNGSGANTLRIFTGTSQPTSFTNGDIWINA